MIRWTLVQGSVGSVLVVVVDVVDDDPLELPAVPHEGAVQELAAQGPDPAFGERVRNRRTAWGLEDLDVFGTEHLVERGGELAAAISNQRLATFERLAVAEEQVSCCLGGPLAGGVRGGPGVELLAA